MKTTKIFLHIRVKGNEEADKAAKQAMDILGMTTTRISIQITTWPSGGRGTLNDKGNGKTALESYTILNHISKNGKVHLLAVDNTKSNWAGYGLDILD